MNANSTLMKITPRPEQVMVRGAGSYLWDEAGRRYLDFLQGWAVNCLGHCPAEVAEVLTRQAGTLITPSPALHNRPQLRLADKLAAHSGLAQVHFSNSGAEANEVALKLARKWGQLHKSGAFRVVSTTNAFHGRTLATMAVSGKQGWDDLFPPAADGFVKVPYGDAQAMADVVDAHTVALMVEPIQGEAGVVMPPPGYLADLRRIADDNDLLLIFDEIQTGVGRTGSLFYFQQIGVMPDIMTLGKGLGGGLPLSATLAGARACCFAYGDQGGTYNGNPLTTAVGDKIIDIVAQPHFLADVQQAEKHLQNGLLQLQQDLPVRAVRGKGLLYALVLAAENSNAVTAAAFDRGLLINAPRPDVLRFMPSLRVTHAEIDEFLHLLRESLAEGS